MKTDSYGDVKPMENDQKTHQTKHHFQKGWTSINVTMVTSRTDGDIADEYTHIKDLKNMHAWDSKNMKGCS